MARRVDLRLFGGSSHPELTRLVAKKVGCRVGDVRLSTFSNGETNVEILENVRGQDLYVIQTGGGARPNDVLMQTLMLISSFKVSGAAGNVTLIAPFFPYSKGDQKRGTRVPITCRLVADLLKRAGASHVMMLDPHTPQIEGFFGMPVDAVKAEPLFCEWIQHHVPGWQSAVVVSPDEGAVKRAVSLANDLGLDFAMIHNRIKESNKTGLGVMFSIDDEDEDEAEADGEEDANVPGSDRSLASASNSASTVSMAGSICAVNSEANCSSGSLISVTRSRVMSESRMGSVSGSVRGKKAIIVDDMIDTGKTLAFALEVLEREGASEVHVVVTHGVFSGGAVPLVKSYDPAFLKTVVVTNSINQEANRLMLDNLHVLDVSGLIAEFIRRHHYRESVSVLSKFMPVPDESKAASDSDERSHRFKASRVRDGSSSPEKNSSKVRFSMSNGNGVGAAAAANTPRRMGFRLSSVCWEDNQ